MDITQTTEFYVNRDGEPDPDWLRKQRIEAVTRFAAKTIHLAVKAPIVAAIALYEASDLHQHQA